MRIIISPAKKMRVDTDSLPVSAEPVFLPKAQRLMKLLQSMSSSQLQSLWGCSDALAKLNVERLQNMDLHRRLTPAILSYEGIQYQYMAPNVLEEQQLQYVQEHLRILSGFYGIVRPFDGVTPYRLEMQAKLNADGFRDLYEFWGDTLARALCEETDCILNLASREYSRAVLPYLPDTVRHITCLFGQEKNGKVVEKGTLCKMARGQMVRWMAEQSVTEIDAVRDFDRLGFRFSPELSSADSFVFLGDGSEKE